MLLKDSITLGSDLLILRNVFVSHLSNTWGELHLESIPLIQTGGLEALMLGKVYERLRDRSVLMDHVCALMASPMLPIVIHA